MSTNKSTTTGTSDALIDKSGSMQATDSQGESSIAQAIESTKKELAQLDDNVIVRLIEAVGRVSRPGGAYNNSGVRVRAPPDNKSVYSDSSPALRKFAGQ
ncbi:MAG: hypothetical protein ACK5Q3_05680 [Planctomycetota bacterium]